jgi:hypothetical protein
MGKWKIILALYCGAVLYLSSVSSGDIPEVPVKVSDKALHLVEYAIMGILAWGAFGKGGLDFHGDCLHFVPALELGMNVFRIGWGMPEIRMCGMRPRMQWVRLLVF